MVAHNLAMRAGAGEELRLTNLLVPVVTDGDGAVVGCPRCAGAILDVDYKPILFNNYIIPRMTYDVMQ